MKSEHSKQKPFILITNDDSVDSPLLAILIEALKFNNDLLVVAPAEEQSWKGKSMTRRGLIEKKFLIGGTSCWAVNGTPADCANIGLHNIAKKETRFCSFRCKHRQKHRCWFFFSIRNHRCLYRS